MKKEIGFKRDLQAVLINLVVDITATALTVKGAVIWTDDCSDKSLHIAMTEGYSRAIEKCQDTE